MLYGTPVSVLFSVGCLWLCLVTTWKINYIVCYGEGNRSYSCDLAVDCMSANGVEILLLVGRVTKLLNRVSPRDRYLALTCGSVYSLLTNDRRSVAKRYIDTQCKVLCYCVGSASGLSGIFQLSRNRAYMSE